MKEKKQKNKKVKLNKEQQLRMLEFFSKSSIPRMLSNKKEFN